MADPNSSTPNLGTSGILNPSLLLIIEDVFSISGRGVVAVGRVDRGTVRTGDVVEISGEGRPTVEATVNGVEKFSKLADHAEVGDQVGLLLRGVQLEDLQSGMRIQSPGTAPDAFPATGGFDILSASSEAPSTFGAAAALDKTDNLSTAAARAADAVAPNRVTPQEFHGLGFTPDTAPGSTRASPTRRIVTALIVLVVVVVAAKLLHLI